VQLARLMMGQGSSFTSILSSAAIVFISFFYIYTIASHFKVPIYVLHNRVVSTSLFTNIYVINKYADHILIISAVVIWLVVSLRGKARLVAAATYGGIALTGVVANVAIIVDVVTLISILLVISFLIYERFGHNKVLGMRTMELSVNYFAIVGISTGLLGVIIWSAIIFFSIPPTEIHVRNYAFEIFLLLSSFSPIVMFLLISCLPVKLVLIELSRLIMRAPRIKNNEVDSSLPRARLSNNKIRLTTKLVYLSFIVLLTIVLVMIPHQSTVNKNNKLVGVDSLAYLNWEKILASSHDAQEFIKKAFVTLSGGDRPIALIFLFAAIKLAAASGPSHVIDHIPVILGPALVLVIYFLARELTRDDTASLFASFMTAVSFHVLVGLYAGFYANWLALIIGYLSFVFLFRYLKGSNKIDLITFFFLTIVVLFSHTYTWTILTVVTGIFLLVMLKFTHYSPRKSVILLLAAVACSAVVGAAKYFVTGTAGGIEQDVSIAQRQQFGVGQLPVRYSNLIDTTEIYYGAAIGNFIILILGLYWLLRSSIHEPISIFLIIFLSIGIFPLFFGNWLVQSRVFYDIPFQIPAAIALAYIKREASGNIILMAICIWLIAMSIRTVTNFGLS
jgi:hypothetical protein